jgi:choline monooxygenase
VFVHKHQLQPLLRSEHYRSESHYQIELERLFRPAWHLVGTKTELSRHGDFLTLDLFGSPLLVCYLGGEHRAFRNVCPLCHCQLATEPHGRRSTYRCPCREWRLDRAEDLLTYRVASLGDLIFISLAAEGPTLDEFLAPNGRVFEPYFSTPRWRLKHLWEYDCPCNWKVPAENTLESYHIPCLHPSSFGGIYPSEVASDHELNPNYTVLRYDSGEDPKFAKWQSRLTRSLGEPPTNLYFHYHIHPHLIFVSTDLFAYALMYIPTSPRTTRIRIRMFSLRGSKRGPVPWLLSKVAGGLGQWTMKRVQMEDWAIFADQQRGLEASRHRGVIGTREERIYVFQQYIRDHCDGVFQDHGGVQAINSVG